MVLNPAGSSHPVRFYSLKATTFHLILTQIDRITLREGSSGGVEMGTAINSSS